MVGIVVLIYKSHEQVLAYVRNELPKIGVPHRALIVDTGSERAHAERLAAELGVAVVTASDTVSDGNLFVLHVEENLGYARGNNLGAEFLTRNFPDTDKLLFSNDDIEFISADVVDVLSRRLDENPEIGCIGPKVIDLNGNCQAPRYLPPDVWSDIRRNFGIPFRGAQYYDNPVPANLQEGEVDSITGCFYMVRASDFIAAGMFDSRTFLYWEENIFKKRLERSTHGHSVYFEPAVSIRHFVGLTTGKHAPNLLLLKCELYGQSLYYREYQKVSAIAFLVLKLSIWCRLALVRLALYRYEHRKEK